MKRLNLGLAAGAAIFLVSQVPCTALAADTSAQSVPKGPPPPQSALFRTAVALYNAKRYSEAEQYFTRVVKQEPANSNAFYYLANCQELAGDKAASKRLYEYIAKYFPNTEAAKAANLYLEKTTSAAPKAVDNVQQMKEAMETIVKKATTAPASIASLVQPVRARADRPEVSKEAVTAIKTAVDGLPQSVKNVLWGNGVRIYVTPTVEDYEPGVKYQEARGYEGGTYKSCPAFCQGRKIVIAERTMNDDESVRDPFPSKEMVNSLYHETGHCLDFCLDDISHSDQFKHAYLLDSARIDPTTAHTLRYYLQKSEGGQEECCAELIGTILGQVERHTSEMKESFPLTIKFLRAKLGI